VNREIGFHDHPDHTLRSGRIPTMNQPDVTQRFSDRVEDYARYRPDYPATLLTWLNEIAGITPRWRVADIGAGTGISSKLFLDAGHAVIAIEPNAPMRTAATRALASYPKFSSVDSRAEATTLADGSVDLVSVAQAFHWFDRAAVRREWKRILPPNGLVVIYWNTRRLHGSPFLERYEQLLRDFGTDYTSVAERYDDDASMRTWFGDGLIGTHRIDHRQLLNFEELRGRLQSSSYAPPRDHPRYESMIAALHQLFADCAVSDRVSFEYDTRVFLGHIT
jgi:SAM-dependent methyltransferase